MPYSKGKNAPTKEVSMSPTELYAVATILTLRAPCASKLVGKEKKSLAGIIDPIMKDRIDVT